MERVRIPPATSKSVTSLGLGTHKLQMCMYGIFPFSSSGSATHLPFVIINNP